MKPSNISNTRRVKDTRYIARYLYSTSQYIGSFISENKNWFWCELTADCRLLKVDTVRNIELNFNQCDNKVLIICFGCKWN